MSYPKDDAQDLALEIALLAAHYPLELHGNIHSVTKEENERHAKRAVHWASQLLQEGVRYSEKAMKEAPAQETEGADINADKSVRGDRL